MIPAILYAARSKAEQPGKDSTGDQIRLIRARIAREGGREIIGEPHVDHASGFRGNRGPNLEAAVQLAQTAGRMHGAGQVEMWVWHTTRLGRGTGRLGEARAIGHLLYELRAAGVTVRSVEDDEFATNEMLWGFASKMASQYSENLAVNVRRGLDSRAAKGFPHGTPAFGYAPGEDGHWVVEPVESTTVERIFRDYTEDGMSYSGIARKLNAVAVPTRKGAAWAPVVIRKLLTSRHVLGEFRHKGEWHQGEHSPIIDQATWDAAQRIAVQWRKYSPGGHSGRIPNNHLFMRGMLRCKCGAAMLPRSDRTGRTWYACRVRTETHGVGGCDMPVMDRAAVDTAALRLFERTALDVEGTRRHITSQMTASMDEARVQATRAGRDVASKRAALDRFDRDYESGDLSAVNYERQVARVGEEVAAAEAEHERLSEHIGELGATLDNMDAEHETFRRLDALRVAVAEHVTAAGATGEVPRLRAAWTRVFESAHIVRAEVLEDVWDDEDMPGNVEQVERFYIAPMVRPEMFDASGSGPASRIPLPADMGGTHVLDQMSTRPP